MLVSHRWAQYWTLTLTPTQVGTILEGQRDTLAITGDDAVERVRYLVITPRGDDAVAGVRYLVITPRGDDAVDGVRYLVITPRGDDMVERVRYLVITPRAMTRSSGYVT